MYPSIHSLVPNETTLHTNPYISYMSPIQRHLHALLQSFIHPSLPLPNVSNKFPHIINHERRCSTHISRYSPPLPPSYTTQIKYPNRKKNDARRTQIQQYRTGSYLLQRAICLVFLRLDIGKVSVYCSFVSRAFYGCCLRAAAP